MVQKCRKEKPYTKPHKLTVLKKSILQEREILYKEYVENYEETKEQIIKDLESMFSGF